MEKFILKNVVLKWPHIYEPHAGITGAKPKHSVCIDATPEIDEVLNPLGLFARNGTENLPYYCATGVFPPLITSRKGDYGVLVQALQIAEARNLSREKLFMGQVVDLVASAFEYNTPVRSGIMLAFHGVIIESADPLLVLALDHSEVEHAAP